MLSGPNRAHNEITVSRVRGNGYLLSPFGGFNRIRFKGSHRSGDSQPSFEGSPEKIKF
jgi:hypothetical protein